MAMVIIGVQPVVVATGGAPGVQAYRIGEVTADGEKAGAAVSCTNDLSVPGNMNLVHWQGEGTSYRIYKAQDGAFGLIGTTDGSYIIDDNIAPDLGQQPPEA